MISVIIPTYNREKTILKAVRSVLNQTYKDLEVIIVDDCSIDSTAKIITGINDRRIRYIKLNKNHGACYARNIGLEHANGDFISFQDSDDYWLPDKLEKQLDNLKNKNSDIDICKIEVINQYGKSIKKIPSVKLEKKLNKYGINSSLAFGNLISTQSILARKECFQEIKFDNNLPRLQDYDLALRITKNRNISYSTETLVRLYIQNDSISTSNKKLVVAIDRMLEKEYYSNSFFDKKLRATLLKDKADSFYNDNNIVEAKKYYKESLHYSFNIKCFIKYLL